MSGRIWLSLVLACTLGVVMPGGVAQGKPSVIVEHYDGASGGEVQTESDYLSKWDDDAFGALPATRTFSGAGVKVSSVPFVSGADFSVFDHLKYIATATKVWPVPADGSLTFGTTLTTRTDGIVPGLVQHGTYVESGAAYHAPLLDVQQASTSLNVVDFCTGMVLDWLITGTTAAPLIERLPSNVTFNTSNPSCPGAKHVGRELMFTQYIREVPISEGVPHRFEITYHRGDDGAYVEYALDGRRVAKVDQVGIPLDRRGLRYTGTYPSLGPGELVDSQVHTLGMAHGLFSVLDAFPFQHPESPELSVSIPVGPGAPGHARLFGQGAEGTWNDFTVTTVNR